MLSRSVCQTIGALQHPRHLACSGSTGQALATPWSCWADHHPTLGWETLGSFGKLPSQVSPCPGEVPPILQLDLSSLEHILAGPRWVAGHPSCSDLGRGRLCTLVHPISLETEGYLPAHCHQQPQALIGQLGLGTRFCTAQAGTLAHRQKMTADRVTPLCPSCLHSGSPCLSLPCRMKSRRVKVLLLTLGRRRRGCHCVCTRIPIYWSRQQPGPSPAPLPAGVQPNLGRELGVPPHPWLCESQAG